MSEPILPTFLITKFSTVIAGALGGLVSFLVDPRLHWRDGLVLVIVGGACSYYLTPSLVYYLNLSQDVSNFISFFTGIVARAVIVKAKEKYPQLIIDKGANILK